MTPRAMATKFTPVFNSLHSNLAVRNGSVAEAVMNLNSASDVQGKERTNCDTVPAVSFQKVAK